MKIFLGIVMVVIGILGLAYTACGVAFLSTSGIGLIGIIPGAVLLWAAYRIWKEIAHPMPAPSQADGGPEQNPPG